ncbi:hypothetical protein V8E36_001914 [Tilletia maclaganii]
MLLLAIRHPHIGDWPSPPISRRPSPSRFFNQRELDEGDRPDFDRRHLLCLKRNLGKRTLWDLSSTPS